MIPKDINRINKQAKQNLTLTSNVRSILKVLNQTWKQQTHRMNLTNKSQKQNDDKQKTLNHHKIQMTEYDLDRLFVDKNKLNINQPHRRFHTDCKSLVSKTRFLRLNSKQDRLLTGLPDSDQEDHQDIINQLFGQRQENLTACFKKNYIIGKIIGSGAYATVREAIYKPLNKKIAIKVYQKQKIQQIQRKKSVRRQIKILQLLDHPNIVKIYDVVESNNHLNIIMEYLSGISLKSYLQSQLHCKISQNNCKKIIKPLVQALIYLHSKNISHRDIKLQNIILNHQLQPKLIDFGFSTCIEHQKKVKMFCGTPSYMAPQIVQKKDYCGQPADIWALGVLIFVSIKGYFPFKGLTDIQLYKNIKNVDYPRNQFDESASLGDLIDKMLTKNPEQRITAEQILKHTWIKGDTNVKKRISSYLQIKKASASFKSKEDRFKQKEKSKYLQARKENLLFQSKLIKHSPQNLRKNGLTQRKVSKQFNKTQKIGKNNKDNSANKKKLFSEVSSKAIDFMKMMMKKNLHKGLKSKIKKE